MAISLNHRQQHAPPELGTGVIAAPEHRSFQVAELVEQEKWVITVALEVPVVGSAFLLSVGLTDRAIEVEDQLFERLAPMGLVDPLAGKVHQRREVALGTERLGLESADFAG